MMIDHRMSPITTASTNTTNDDTKDLGRDDFKRVNLKGMGKRYYFSFQDALEKVEICLEPCFNGFDIGVYRLEDSELENKKQCTNLDKMIYKVEEDAHKTKTVYSQQMLMNLELRGTLERSDKAWKKALDIASKLYRQIRNENRLDRWRMLEKTGAADPTTSPNPSAPASPSFPIPSLYYNSKTLEKVSKTFKKLTAQLGSKSK